MRTLYPESAKLRVDDRPTYRDRGPGRLRAARPGKRRRAARGRPPACAARVARARSARRGHLDLPPPRHGAGPARDAGRAGSGLAVVVPLAGAILVLAVALISALAETTGKARLLEPPDRAVAARRTSSREERSPKPGTLILTAHYDAGRSGLWWTLPRRIPPFPAFAAALLIVLGCAIARTAAAGGTIVAARPVRPHGRADPERAAADRPRAVGGRAGSQRQRVGRRHRAAPGRALRRRPRLLRRLGPPPRRAARPCSRACTRGCAAIARSSTRAGRSS